MSIFLEQVILKEKSEKKSFVRSTKSNRGEKKQNESKPSYYKRVPFKEKGIGPFDVGHLNAFSYWSAISEQRIPHYYIESVVENIESKSISIDSNGEKFEVDYSNLAFRNTAEISKKLDQLWREGVLGSNKPDRNNSYLNISTGYCLFWRKTEKDREFLRKGIALRLEDGVVIKWDLDE